MGIGYDCPQKNLMAITENGNEYVRLEFTNEVRVAGISYIGVQRSDQSEGDGV